MSGEQSRTRPFLVPAAVVAGALLLAVLPLPYGYYDFLRLLVAGMSVWLWILLARHNKLGWLGLVIPALILWNPILPIPMTRAAWILPDLAGAAAFAILSAIAIVPAATAVHMPARAVARVLPSQPQSREQRSTMSSDAPLPPAGWYPSEAGGQRWWDGAQWSDRYSAAPAPAPAPSAAAHAPVVNPYETKATVPGRTAGFVLGLIALLLVAIPIVCIPLGVVGWIQSAKALRLLPAETPGRGLAIAGLVLSIAAVGITSLFMLLAIPGAFERNFG